MRPGSLSSGAFVKLKHAERRLTFLVISQEQGRFEAKDLPPGQYRRPGVGAGFRERVGSRCGRVRRAERQGRLSLPNKHGCDAGAGNGPQRIRAPESSKVLPLTRRICRKAG